MTHPEQPPELPFIPPLPPPIPPDGLMPPPMVPQIPPVPGPKPEPELSIPSMLVSEWARDLIMTVAASNPRSRQAELGASEIGQMCERRIGYRLAGTPVINHPDPLKALFGTGMHHVLAEGLARLNLGNRYLIEHPVVYRSIPGMVDCADWWRHRVTDWKTSALDVIKRYKREGVGTNYRVQIAIYAEGLRALGYEVEETALVFIPRDGTLSDIWSWVSQPNKALADEYIDRYAGINARLTEAGTNPGALEAAPGPLCSYCPNHQRGASDLTLACPGKDQ